MKIFSMIFTASFFLSFVSMASAEDEYTITNKIEEVRLVAYFPDLGRLWTIDYDECLQVKASDFNHLKLTLVIEEQEGVCICCPQQTCPYDNYVALNEARWWHFSDRYIMKTEQHYNRDCFDPEKRAQLYTSNDFHSMKQFLKSSTDINIKDRKPIVPLD